MKRDLEQIVDRENAIPTTDPDIAASRLNREIRNGCIRDAIDLEAALRSREYSKLRPSDAAIARARFAR